HSKRQEYIKKIIEEIQRYSDTLIVFLDPDTGIAPKSAKPEHATSADIQEIWEAVKPRDWLVMYQHASRDTKWIQNRRAEFSKACNGVGVKTIQGLKIAGD